MRVRDRGIVRGVALGVCAALPLSFYVVGDLTDAFPGVLTLQRSSAEAADGPHAVGEDYDKPSLTPLAPTAAPTLDSAASRAIQARMDALAADPVVKGHLAFSVVDVASGATIAQRDQSTARTPASTLKVLTSLAALHGLDGSRTLATTSVLTGSTVTLVGGGDMRLTPAQIATLAEKTAAAAKKAGHGSVALRLDDTLFSGGVNPAWGANGPAGGWVAPTSALAVNEGWLDAEEFGRKSMDPAMDAATMFAQQLAAHGVTVSGSVARAKAPPGGVRNEIRSAPISDLVEHTLLVSDNTTAEVLGRLVAIESGKPATAQGAAQAVQQEITALAAQLKVPSTGLSLADVCGLAVADRVPPALLAGLIAKMDGTSTAPGLRQMLARMPIAGLSGTLAERFQAATATGARGIVRAKTGYLGGTSSLAGLATLADGRTVAFSIVVHSFPPEQGVEAKAATDAVAAAMVR